ncbi:MAG: aminodeoxychorismate synthase component I [Rhodothermales bacterium]
MNRPNDFTASEEAGLIRFGPGWRGLGDVTFRSPVEVFVAREVRDVRHVLSRACRAAESGMHVAGFVAYEAAPAFDRAYRAKEPNGPLVWMGVYDRSFASSPARRGSADVPDGASGRPSAALADARFAYDAASYRDTIARLREHIREGDVYQINFTGPLDFVPESAPYRLFELLTARQPVPYAAFVDTGEIQVVSCSPELFFDRCGEFVVTRPMKGTVRRGEDPDEDDALERWLSLDEKSRAENLMIVDLLRNDLSRCCIPGSVQVPELFATERYRTVIQMTSEVQGRLRTGMRTPDVFEALFPCGSVTGAPKIRAMELIDRYEPESRGVYCGAVGYMHGERAIFNVAIRTTTVRCRTARLGIGSGIVWDSDPAAEYDECLLKADFLTAQMDGIDPKGERAANKPPLLLIETMQSRAGDIALLERHIDRLRSSATMLGFAFDEASYRGGVVEAVPEKGVYRVRATLSREGSVFVETSPLDEADGRRWRARISDDPIDAGNVFRRHKTTRRDRYDEALRAAMHEGYDEVIFLNERGDVAEGARSNIIAEFGEARITPPVQSGALPGVYRQYLLETDPRMRESILTQPDLERADAVYFCNALRGLVRAEVVYSQIIAQTEG